jgi:hypothetical protein
MKRLLLALVCLSLWIPSYSVEKRSPLGPDERRLYEAELRYLNNVTIAYASQGCVLELPPEPELIYVTEQGMAEACSPFALACYHPFYHRIYAVKGDWASIGHEMQHAILSKNHLSENCWQHLIILQADHILEPHIKKFEEKIAKSQSSK